MKKRVTIITGAMIILAVLWAAVSYERGSGTGGAKGKHEYRYPDFYRGMYLTSESAVDPGRFDMFIDAAEKSFINTLVIDVQTSRYKENMVPAGFVKKCQDAGLHPVARVVVFPGGLAKYPAPEGAIDGIIDIAERAAKAGFMEIQFDYIRFSDEDRHTAYLSHVTYGERYMFIQAFFNRARKRLAPYNVRIAADVFGRIPHKEDDRIGQKMEVLDLSVDMVCPMAYPSHYWTTAMQYDPYSTVKWTSSEARRRLKKAGVVTWIQAFRMNMPPDMAFKEYVMRQIKAVHDSDVKGFFLWNARQVYHVPLEAVREYYGNSLKDQAAVK